MSGSRAATLLLAAALSGLLSACTGAPPQIVSIEVSLEYVDDLDLNRRYEQLTLFALVRDEDGFGDISEFYLIHDEAELYWRFDAQSWTHRRVAGENWVGFSGLSMADWGELPRGQYRTVVIDRAGEHDERTVSIDAPGLSSVHDQLPQLDLDLGSITVPEVGASLLVVSDDEDSGETSVTPERTLAGGRYPLDALVHSDSDIRSYLYVPLGSYYGSLTGPIRR